MATRKAPQVPGDVTQDDDAPTDMTLPEPTQQEAQAVAATGLPRAADIDPKTLSRAVLTQDGWVCPG